jgi:TolB protein
VAIVVGTAIGCVQSSPGGLIAFASSRDGNAEIYSVRPDGSSLTRITNNSYSDGAPAWSAGGQCLVFASYRGGTGRIYRIDRDGTQEVLLIDTHTVGLNGLSWAPYPNAISYDSNLTGNWDIHALDPSGLPLGSLVATAANEYLPAWAPNGQSIAYTTHVMGEDVWTKQINGQPATQLTTDQWYDKQPRWSWDGQWIVFISNRDGDGSEYDIFKIRPDGTQETQLTFNEEQEMYPSWSPDGQWIAYESGYSNSQIFIMKSDGSEQTLVTEGTTPYWGPDGIAPEPACDATVASRAASPSTPPSFIPQPSGSLPSNEPSAEPSASEAPRPPDLRLTKTSAGDFTYGGVVSYTVTVNNRANFGPAERPIIVTDQLPPGTLLSWSGNDWDCSVDQANLVTCEYLSDLPAGESAPPLTFDLQLPDQRNWPGSDVIQNCATVEHPADANSDNNTRCVDDQLVLPPSAEPTAAPSAAPSAEPTAAPSAEPSASPSEEPRPSG